jgi:hypothetical protein
MQRGSKKGCALARSRNRKTVGLWMTSSLFDGEGDAVFWEP